MFLPCLNTPSPCCLFIRIHCLLTSIFQTAKIGSLVDIQDSEDPEGLRVFYYLVQDLKVRCFFIALMVYLCVVR